jgi:hypothetical protein
VGRTGPVRPVRGHTAVVLPGSVVSFSAGVRRRKILPGRGEIAGTRPT